MTPINRDQIAAMIPHAGSMCLLDSILHWDTSSIHALSCCHKRRDNPLRRADGSLGMACGIEIAAQAMAVHGRLTSTGSPRASEGYLASVRDLRLRATRLDNVDGDLLIEAECLMGDDRCATYRFTLGSKSMKLVSGRAMVLFSVMSI